MFGSIADCNFNGEREGVAPAASGKQEALSCASCNSVSTIFNWVARFSLRSNSS